MCSVDQSGIAKESGCPQPSGAPVLNLVILGYNREEFEMHKTSLRKVGGSVMLIVPPPVLKMLNLRPGESVGMTVEKGRLVVQPQERRRYTLEELLAQCRTQTARSRQDREWLQGGRVGKEVL